MKTHGGGFNMRARREVARSCVWGVATSVATAFAPFAAAAQVDSIFGMSRDYGRVEIASRGARVGCALEPDVARTKAGLRADAILGIGAVATLGTQVDALFQAEGGVSTDSTPSYCGESNQLLRAQWRNTGALVRSNIGTLLVGYWQLPSYEFGFGGFDAFGDTGVAAASGAFRLGSSLAARRKSVQLWVPFQGVWHGSVAFAPRDACEAVGRRPAVDQPGGGTLQCSTLSAGLKRSSDPYHVAAYAFDTETHNLARFGARSSRSTGYFVSGGALAYRIRLYATYGRVMDFENPRIALAYLGANWHIRGLNYGQGSFQNMTSKSPNGARVSCNIAALGYRYDYSPNSSYRIAVTHRFGDRDRTCENYADDAMPIGRETVLGVAYRFTF